MNINQLDVKDINIIVELIWNVQIESRQIPIMFQNEESKENFKKNMLEKMDDILSFYGAFDNEKFIGVIGIEENRISYLYVLKEYQNKGIGTKLLRFALDIFKKNNYNIVLIDSVEEAKAFYKKNGFRNKNNKDYSIAMEYKIKRFKPIFKI